MPLYDGLERRPHRKSLNHPRMALYNLFGEIIQDRVVVAGDFLDVRIHTNVLLLDRDRTMIKSRHL